MSKKVCGAKKKTGGNCRRRPMLNGRCYLHGGRSLAGKDSPLFKHGRYSKYLPANLQERANELLKSRRLFEAKDDLALLQLRLCGLLEGRAAGLDFWDLAATGISNLKVAISEGDAEKRQATVAELDELFSRGFEDASAWEEIYRIEGMMNKVRDSNTRRDAVKSNSLSVIEAQALIERIVMAVRQHVTDTDTLVKISREFGQIMNAEPEPGTWESPYRV